MNFRILSLDNPFFLCVGVAYARGLFHFKRRKSGVESNGHSKNQVLQFKLDRLTRKYLSDDIHRVSLENISNFIEAAHGYIKSQKCKGLCSNFYELVNSQQRFN